MRSWRSVGGGEICGKRCKWLVANRADIGLNDALVMVANQYPDKCRGLAHVACANVLSMDTPVDVRRQNASKDLRARLRLQNASKYFLGGRVGRNTGRHARLG